MTKKIKFSLFFTAFSFLFATHSFAVRYANILDGAERILYGREKISAPFLMILIENINEKERDRNRQHIKIRSEEESKAVIEESKKALLEKIEKNKTDEELFNENKRVAELLSLDTSFLDPIPFSYLLEKINSEY